LARSEALASCAAASAGAAGVFRCLGGCADWQVHAVQQLPAAWVAHSVVVMGVQEVLMI
jgi:hypothetical protein